jgi:hypothetical protein
VVELSHLPSDATVLRVHTKKSAERARHRVADPEPGAGWVRAASDRIDQTAKRRIVAGEAPSRLADGLVLREKLPELLVGPWKFAGCQIDVCVEEPDLVLVGVTLVESDAL